MTTRTYRTVLVRLASMVFVLLLGAASVGAQEEHKQKEPPKKPAVHEKQGAKQPAKAIEKKAEPATANQPQPSAVQRSPQAQTERAAQQQQQQAPQGSRAATSGRGQQGQQGGQRGATRAWPARSAEPGQVITTRGGDTVRRDQSGRVAEVRVKSGAVVYHAPTGVRRVEVVRPGGRLVVAEAPGHGYVQRQVLYNNRPLVKRTYFADGRAYARLYRPVTYHGVMFQIYTPVRFYRPPFYAYLFNPWLTPVAWNWGWAGYPWYGYYGGYFAPYAYYSSPALWLTDFFIGATLQAAYQERLAAGVTPMPVAGDDVTLTPEVKQLIADEVRRQIEQERAEGQSVNANYAGDDVPVWADNSSHVFVAYTALGVNSSLGYCTIGEGDVVQLNRVPPPSASSADVVVLASRRQDCRRGSVVSVQLQDLQDMSNRMRETVETGLGDLQAHQGQSGIPPLPSGAAGTVDTPLAAEATPDMNAGAELNQVYRDTDQAERAAVGQAAGDTAAATPTISLGQSIQQVRAILGAPQQIMDAGSKQIYIYRNVKITFINGLVSDIQ
jgi:hypothetical protein